MSFTIFILIFCGLIQRRTNGASWTYNLQKRFIAGHRSRLLGNGSSAGSAFRLGHSNTELPEMIRVVLTASLFLLPRGS
jgi:hypothetical protein